MDENTLAQLLQGQRQGPSERSRRCPDDARLAAYVDQQLPGDLKESLETHLAGCDSCLSQVSFLVKSSELPDAQSIAPQVLSRARNLVFRKRSVWGDWRWTVATAAAACLVFAVLLGIAWQLGQSRKSAYESLVAKNQPPQPETPSFRSPARVETPPARINTPGPEQTESPRPTRAPVPGVRRPSSPGALSPDVLFPSERATVASGDLVVRWTPVNEAAFYELTLMTDAGDVVFAGRSTDAQLKLPAHVKLTPGSKYFVQVAANMPQGNTIKSPVVAFRISH